MPSLSSATPTTQRHPQAWKLYIADHRSSILATTLVAHVLHWSYLTRYRRISPGLREHRGKFGRLGLAWAAVYVVILSAITVSIRDVKNTYDPLLRRRYP